MASGRHEAETIYYEPGLSVSMDIRKFLKKQDSSLPSEKGPLSKFIKLDDIRVANLAVSVLQWLQLRTVKRVPRLLTPSLVPRNKLL